MAVNDVTVVRVPGYPEHFKAKVIPGLGDIPARDDRGVMAVISFGDEELSVVPAAHLVYGLDLVKRFEVDYDWDRDSWGVRHAFDGPFVWHGVPNACHDWISNKS